MNFLKRLFSKKTNKNNRPRPEWETIVKTMHDKGLDAFSDEVVKVIYSKNMSMRYVILKDESGIFTYQLEKIYQFDDQEWSYICSYDNAPAATWVPFEGVFRTSFFSNTEDLMREIKAEPEYKQYFE